ncbi:MAG: substrate-binding domain-containing protein [Spirochaetales bacterium]|nr:substrate-binding domain-containing protein [Spirochaetales bacterium]
MKRFVFFLTIGIFAVTSLSAAGRGEPTSIMPSALAEAQADRVRLATTTSTENSGLLDMILPVFTEMYGIAVDVVAVGTGAALELGRNGDADVVMVHARSLEDQFVAEGYGVNRRDIMYNDFIILGPADDPAGVAEATSASEAMSRIAAAEAVFISRGDNSGTHNRELQLWESAGVTPAGRWYREVGQGMGAVIAITDEEEAYTLADRGTFISFGVTSTSRCSPRATERSLIPTGSSRSIPLATKARTTSERWR